MNNELVHDYSNVRLSFYENIICNLLTKIKLGGLSLKTDMYTQYFGDPNHSLQAEIEVHDKRFFAQVFWGGGIGLAKAFMLEHWESKDLTKLLQIFSLNLHVVDRADQSVFVSIIHSAAKFMHYLSRNNITGSKKNISKHYDLGNEFFTMFLDPIMMYSCAQFDSLECTLEQASLNKLKNICAKLELKASDHVLEIGTGWGGFAIYAVQNFNCQVTTTTISKQQYLFVNTRIVELGLQDKIQVLLQDYRNLKGQYDKIVSIEMIEAVGHQYFNKYFQQCSNLLKANGLFLLQAITISEQRYKAARDSVDFIKHFIFPGGCVPSLGEILKSIKAKSDYALVSIEDITLDYSKTIHLWRQKFIQNYNEISQQGFDNEFMRKWLYYFSYCEAGFLERIIYDQQILLAKPHYRVAAID